MVTLETSCTKQWCNDDDFAFISKCWLYSKNCVCLWVSSGDGLVCVLTGTKYYELWVNWTISSLKDSSLKFWIAFQAVQTCLNGERLKQMLDDTENQQLRERRQGAGGMLADYLSNVWGVWTRVRVGVYLVLVHVHTSRRNVPPAGSCQLLTYDRYGADTPRYDSWDLSCGSVSFHASHKSTQNENKMAGEEKKCAEKKKYRLFLEKVLK